jgi:HEAT repeat protein
MAGITRLIRLAILAFSMALALGVSPHRANAGGSPLTSLADALRAKGIDLSRPSLLDALHNSDPEVRGLAANKLAENHDAEALSAIKEALSVETNPRARINFGLALWTLHDPGGLTLLHAMCAEPSLSIDTIVAVVQELSVMNESTEPCVKPVLTFLDTHLDSESRARSLFALPDLYPWATPVQAEAILRMLLGMLSDGDPYVRMQTAQSLVQIGLPSSAGPIRAQMLRETDPNIRDSLQTALDMLARKQ